MDGLFLPPLLEGFGTGSGLIVAIGPQNAFVLRQGLTQNYVFLSALICTLTDVVLILIGVGGLGTLIATSPFLIKMAAWGGAAFLFTCAYRSFKAAFLVKEGVTLDQQKRPNLRTTWLTLVTVGILNPHAVLDACILLGSVSSQYSSHQRVLFGAGAVVASAVWFFGLAYGSRFLTPLFQKPMAWRILDTLIGLMMMAIGVSLLGGF